MRKELAAILVVVMVLSLSLLVNSPVPAASDLKKRGMFPKTIETITQPPANFNPLTATAEELTKYGFPGRPTDKKHLEEWESAMKHAKQYAKPEQTPSAKVHSSLSNDHWAGYIVRSVNNKNKNNNLKPNYVQVCGTWIQPAYFGSATPSFWIGIGADSVVQAGADSHASFFTHYEFWVEDWPNGTIWERYPFINGGDKLYEHIEYKGSASSAFLENETTGQYTSVSFETPYYDGTTADFIHEAVSGIYGSWGTTPFIHSRLEWKDYSGAGGTGELTDFNYTEVIMTNDGTRKGSIEAIPSYPPANGSFNVSSY